MNRYTLEDVAVVIYHLHIPMPDPMTNPSTLARAEFCSVQGTPSYAIDGQMESGGGLRNEAKSYYEKLIAKIENSLEEPAKARIILNAFYQDGMVKAKVTVDEVVHESSELRLQVALVEDELSYSGQNNQRFHPMVVRSLGGEKHLGFIIDPSEKTTIEQSFDLEKITKELEQHLSGLEKERDMTFTQKKHVIDGEKLSVVAFLQVTETKEILQAAYVDVHSNRQF